MNALELITATVEPGTDRRDWSTKQNKIKRQLTCKPWLERLASHIGGEVHLWPKSGIWYLAVQDKSFFLQAPFYPARSPELEYKLLFVYSGPRKTKLLHEDYDIKTYEDLVRVVRDVLGTVTATVEPTSTVPEHRVTAAGFRVLPGHHTSGGLHDFTVVPRNAPRDGACLGVLVWVRTSENKVHSASVRKIGLRAGSVAWHQQTDTAELGPREDLVAYIRSRLKEHL